MASIQGRGGSRRRRGMNEINMVPFIDVMLVLLIIFMVSAPLITTGVVDVPSVGKARQRPPGVVEVIVDRDEKLKLRIDTKDAGSVTMSQLAARVKQAQGSDGRNPAEVPVVISADRQVKYESVVKVMDVLQKAGVQRVGLTVKQGG